MADHEKRVWRVSFLVVDHGEPLGKEFLDAREIVKQTVDRMDVAAGLDIEDVQAKAVLLKDYEAKYGA